MRAVAVLLVLGRHGDGPPFWKNVGWVGVDLFFVLSGFLISGLLFVEYKRTGGIRWGRFFVRRGFKIYPPFYAMILVTFVLQVATHQKTHWNLYLPELLFFQSYAPDRIWDHTWSLAVEEHFYILLPLLLLIMLWFQRKKRVFDPFRLVPAMWLVLAISCLLQRSYLIYMASPTKYWWVSILFPTHLRIDSLFFGVFLGYLHHFHGPELERFMAKRWARTGLLVVSALLVSICGVFGMESHIMLSVGLTALSLGFGGILIFSIYHNPSPGGEVFSWLGKLQAGRLLAYIGMYSYSIYLWHLMVSKYLHGLLPSLWPNIGETLSFWIYVLLSLAIGILLSLAIEYPILRLRDRLFPSSLQPVKIEKQDSSFPLELGDTEQAGSVVKI